MSTKYQRHFSATMRALTTEQSPVISQEGIVQDLVDSVLSLFKYRPADHNALSKKALHADNERVQSIRKLKKLLDKCFLNDRWLDHHEFVVGPVSASGIANRLCFGDKFNIVKPLEQVVIDATELNVEMKVVKAAALAHHNYIDSEHKKLLRLLGPSLPSPEELEVEYEGSGDFSGLLGTKCYDAFNQFLKDFERSGQYARLSGEHFYKTSNGKLPRFGGQWSIGDQLSNANPTLPKELSALTRDQIKKAGQIIVKWLDAEELNEGWLDGYGVEVDPDPISYFNINGHFWCCVEDLEIGQHWADLVGQEAFQQQWKPKDGRDTNLQVAIIGLIHWMDRSIKGRL